MSTDPNLTTTERWDGDPLSDPRNQRINRYRDPENPDRYADFAEEALGIRLANTQRRILRAIAQHRYVLIESGNGVGKTFALATANLGFLFSHLESICFATSATYDVLIDNLWKPMRNMHAGANLPGRCKESPPRIEELPTPGASVSFFKSISPTNPKNLEGRHSAAMLVTVEEADSKDITSQHIDSAESSITSEHDRMVVVANPPDTEANIVADLASKDKYEHIQFSSFESHNVIHDLTEDDEEYIPGLVTREKLREDWEDWNNEPWPGFDEARTAHDRRDDLDERWYRRRGGRRPPGEAAVHRPFYTDAIGAAYTTSHEAQQQLTQTVQSTSPRGTGIDVARSGDRTVLASVHGNAIEIHYSEQGASKPEQEPALRDLLDPWPDHPVAIDAIGTGSGLASDLQQAYPKTIAFQAGSDAARADQYKNKWTEGLAALGEFLADGGELRDRRLREELLVAARSIEYETKYYKSREAEVLIASSKSVIKDRLGRSPDHLDAAILACWAASEAPARLGGGPAHITRPSARKPHF